MFGNVTLQQFIQCASVAVIGTLLSGCAHRTSQQPTPIPVVSATAKSTIWDGVYTEQQRRRGEAVYEASCIRCHGPDLAKKDIVPALVGEKFLKKWKRKRVGNLFAFMRAEMPPEDENELASPEEYADVLAFVLSKNQAPVGEQELASNFAALQAIRMSDGD